MRMIVALATVAALAACSAVEGRHGAGNGDVAPATLDAAGESGPGDSASAEGRSGGAHKVSEETGDYHFEYSWPTEAGEIEELATLLEERLATARTELAAIAATERKQAEAADYPFRPFSEGMKWEVVADLPRWLSLSAERYSYSGGAHGMATFDSLVWDRQVGRALEPIGFFRSASALSEAASERFCAELDRQRAKKRGAPVDKSDENFGQCIDPVENSTVILGSSNGTAFDRIGFLVPPYNAGPYAEGAYEITLPANRALLDAVKPEYRDSFTAAR